MASIRKRGKRYQVRIKIKGSEEITKTLPTLALAREFAAETEAKVYRGLYFGPGYDKTLGDAIDYYMERVAPVRLTSKTIATHRTALELWRQTELGDKLLAHITAGDIADIRDQLCVRYKNVSVNRYFVALSSVLTMAEERDWIGINPCRKVRKLPDDSRREVCLDDQARRTLLRVCGIRSSSLWILVLAALETGARRGELESLESRDVDLERQTITFRDTKNGDTRTIPMPPALNPYLGLIIRGGADRPFAPLNAADWNAARDTAEMRHVRFHDLRHTFATNKVKEGHNIRQIAQMLGHRDLNMMMRYAHVSVEDMRGLVA
jgi:integrase